MKIAIFDSGIGGLSVLHLALKKLPKENFIYFADKKNVPYGTKTTEEIIDLVDEAINFILTQNVKAIVIACNTATSAAIQIMREKFKIPIIGMEPAVKKAVNFHENKRILCMATPITVKGKKLKDLIERVDTEHVIDLIPLPELVSFAESEIFDKKIITDYLNDKFKNFNLDDYSSVVIGCTHFNYFKDSLAEIFKNKIHFFDGNDGTINRLIYELESRKLLDNNNYSSVEFYYSGEKVKEKSELEKLNRYLKRLDKMLNIK